MLLQAFQKIPNTEVLIKPAKDAMNNAIVNSGVESDYKINLRRRISSNGCSTSKLHHYYCLSFGFNEYHHYISILRKFKVATPMFDLYLAAK